MNESQNSDRKESSQAGSTIVIHVGTRNSQLALIQTSQVISKLKEFYLNNPDQLKLVYPDYFKSHDGSIPMIEFNVISMKTIGDKVLDKPLPEIGAKSLFTKELEIELVEGRVDMIVHSLKDLPTTLPDNCVIGAVMKRDSPDDAIVLKKSLVSKLEPIDLLLKGHGHLKIGTSSQRRIAMLRRSNPNIECKDIRGNLNTRLAKLDNEDGEYAAIILAQAGLNRMGWSERSSSLLTPQVNLDLADWCYAVAQGAIAIECKSTDHRLMRLLRPIMDPMTTFEVVSERSLMRKLEGGCSVPLGVRSTWTDERTLCLEAMILSIDGSKCVKASDRIKLNELSNLDHTEPTPGLIKEFSGIVGTYMNTAFHDNLEKCFDLGLSVANKMINLGCLELIRRDK